MRDATGSVQSSPLDVLPRAKRGMYGQMIELIYECSTNRVAAKSLVDRILERIASRDDANAKPTARKSSKSKKTKRSSKARAGKRKPRAIAHPF